MRGAGIGVRGGDGVQGVQIAGVGGGVFGGVEGVTMVGADGGVGEGRGPGTRSERGKRAFVVVAKGLWGVSMRVELDLVGLRVAVVSLGRRTFGGEVIMVVLERE